MTGPGMRCEKGAKWGRIDPDAPLLPPVPIVTTKRAVQYLEDMLAKPEGISAIEYPGQRLADGIFKLRGAGLDIETLHEPHKGSSPGTHARYQLRSKVVRLRGIAVHGMPNVEQVRVSTSEAMP